MTVKEQYQWVGVACCIGILKIFTIKYLEVEIKEKYNGISTIDILNDIKN